MWQDLSSVVALLVIGALITFFLLGFVSLLLRKLTHQADRLSEAYRIRLANRDAQQRQLQAQRWGW